ncbi:MAG: DUF58 domain-containing protein [Oscillospiraceae bacterium]|nr:DUF58 domain-containing protein [Oscillospiraceae bacterium]MBQ9907888.1 DUF58 domain-containing protein [Oscillospiraceae bacterium]MBR5363551.1 DUF58 domain-containing protein [Oscillospiraceae bacterium]
MIRAKLLYAALIVVLVLFFVLYRGNLSFELLIFVLLFPVILWLMLLRLRSAVKISLFHSKGPILKGQIYQWSVQVRNTSFLSTPHAQVTVEYRNSLTGKPTEMTLELPVLPRNTQRLRLAFHAVTCGVMQIQLKKFVIYDPIRLFHRTIRLSLQDSIVIMPVPAALLPEEWPPVPQPDADSAEYSKTKAGDDPSEIFDLHTYREGDLVSRIHWKLSSKLDTLMVKEYSLPLSAGCLLLTDCRHVSRRPDSALRLDAMFSAVSAAAAQLSEQSNHFAMTSYHPAHGLQTSEMFTALPDAAQWIRHMVRQTPVMPEERPAFLQAIHDFLAESHTYERILIFTPRLDDKLTELLLSLPDPERFTVFAVLSPQEPDSSADSGSLLRWIPVLIQEPVHPVYEPVREEDGSDFDCEELVEGGAEP